MEGWVVLCAVRSSCDLPKLVPHITANFGRNTWHDRLRRSSHKRDYRHTSCFDIDALCGVVNLAAIMRCLFTHIAVDLVISRVCWIVWSHHYMTLLIPSQGRCKQWCAEFSCWRPRASCRSSASFRVSQRASSSHQLLSQEIDQHLLPITIWLACYFWRSSSAAITCNAFQNRITAVLVIHSNT